MAKTPVPHEFRPLRGRQGETQCIWCEGTNRDVANLSPNHCDERAKLDRRAYTDHSAPVSSELLTATQYDRSYGAGIVRGSKAANKAKMDSCPLVQSIARIRIYGSRPATSPVDHSAPDQASGELTAAQLAYAADVAERFVLADIDANDIAGLRDGICGDGAIEDFARIVNGKPCAPDQARELLAELATKWRDRQADEFLARIDAYLKGVS